jgi:hypothetical protein
MVPLRSVITHRISSRHADLPSPLPKNSKSGPQVISVAVVPSLRRLYCLVTLLNSDSGEKSLVVISVVIPYIFVGGHSGSLPSGGAAISPWLAPARHTVTRLSDIQRSIDINNFPLPVLQMIDKYSWMQWGDTLDCKNGARVLYSSIVSYTPAPRSAKLLLLFFRRPLLQHLRIVFHGCISNDCNLQYLVLGIHVACYFPSLAG